MQPTRHAVLDAIADGPVSGPTLAGELDISRSAIWKHIEALREDGFDIASGSGGYELVSVPEFGGPAIEFGLDAEFTVEYYDSIASTNERARDLGGAGESDIVVVADEQTGGKGRLDRGWSSPSGGVWLSMLLRPDVPPAQAPAFTLAAAVAATRAAREAGVDAEIKWPNDLLVPGEDGDRKLAGILTEMEGEADRISWLVIGIGINANVDPAEIGSEQPATSIRAEVGDIERRVFVQRLVEEFDDLRTDLDSVVPAWREYASTLGQRVRVDTPGGEVVGEAIDIAFPGALVVETDDGRVEVTAGDCEHLRPVEE
jgi:BirA family biotin operon repressor/biotin-[acetyl-CoA-carboxylase] ligase